MRIAIVDYGMGNIHSIIGALKYLGITDVIVSNDYDELNISDKLILPGVGAFGKAIKEIKDRSLDNILREIVIKGKRPILGICLGMQILSSSSNEDGEHLGLGFIETRVEKFEEENLTIPHVGFNQIDLPLSQSRLFKGFKDHPDFYFTHSYRMIGSDDIVFANCNYGGNFIAAFEKANIAGAQFHPELSQTNGLKFLDNFLREF
ncbi:imidazole glycerol phosphate synthase subunit HisH [Sphingobacterium spiritivorum]|uniref:imidazole glycerol phosphate synthase subunit HisH n=1 Tax=Sphingobacterium spiritivorum TaxID=258 RepID=UPI003DA3356D